jgi:hypothetical protein
MEYCYPCGKKLDEGSEILTTEWDELDDEMKKKTLDELEQPEITESITIDTTFSELPQKCQDGLVECGWNIGGPCDECSDKYVKEHKKEMEKEKERERQEQAYLIWKGEQDKKDELHDEADRIDSVENPDGYDDVYKDDT